MAHYLIAHLNGGRYGDVQILSSAGIDELHRGAVEFSDVGVSDGRYGMGWFDHRTWAKRKPLHTAAIVPDFSAFMALLPEQKKGVVLLLNADHYDAPRHGGGRDGRDGLLAGQQPAPIQLGLYPVDHARSAADPGSPDRGRCRHPAAVTPLAQGSRRRPSRGRVWGQHILLPLIPNLLLALILIPAPGQIRLSAALSARPCLDRPDQRQFCRDMGFLRTGLILRALRK